MKKIIITAILASLLFNTIAFAQKANNNRQRRNDRREGSARERRSTASSTQPSAVTSPIDQSVIASCVKTAVVKRDSTLATAVDTFAEAFKSAVSERTANVSAALDLTDKKSRKDAIKNASMKFHDAKQGARKAFNASGKSAWDGFRADIKTCGGASDEHGNAGEDNL